MSHKCAIGVDVGGTHIKAGIVSIDGEIILEHTFATEALSGKNVLLSQIEDIVLSLKKKAAKQKLELAGVGIGTAGYISHDGIVGGATDNLPGWSGTRLKEEMETRIRLPVAVDNDVNAMAMGEVWLGAGRARNDFICISLGTGVGGCFIQNRQPYRGRSGFAGGYGHQVILMDGYPCTCGLKGCWEQYASVTALKRLIHEMAGDSATKVLSTREIFAQARMGDLTAVAIIDQYAYYIAIGLANLIHIFNPNAIIIGGAITAQGDFLFERIVDYVHKHTLKIYLAEPVCILPAELGNIAGMIGAAKLAINRVF